MAITLTLTWGIRTLSAWQVVAKSVKALNHKDTKAQRKPFWFVERSSGKPGKTLCPGAFVVPFFSGTAPPDCLQGTLPVYCSPSC